MTILPNTKRDYAYYEALGFANSASWSNKDLAGFLIYDYLDAFQQLGWARDMGEQSIFNALIQKAKKFQHHNLQVKVLDALLFTLYQNGEGPINNKKKFLFEGSKYADLILELKKHHQVRFITQGRYE